jgi:radical SAM superfamily enzyme YgiQ (UPF0313 family)
MDTLAQQGTLMTAPPCQVLLVYPRFTAPSFLNCRVTCELFGARYPLPPLGLITVAALLPASWEVRLVDRNTGDLTPADLDAADLIMTGGMLSQRADTLAIIKMCKEQRMPVVIGGPDVTSSPYLFAEADLQIRGEAESVVEAFVKAWTSGKRQGVFEAGKFQVDMTRSPIPRFELLQLDHYIHMAVQFSRGCPFNCEFCDIIELYGRIPRTKTSQQIVAELDVLYRLGYRGRVFFVDDNFVGNKKELRRLLPVLIEWQRLRKHPFEFLTQASINLADDSQLLEMMQQANFYAVFIGIESPDTDTLIAMQKKQNTRRSLATSISRIHAAGILVMAGLVIGFDSENESVADDMIECIEATSIPVCLVGLLYALANTQLSRRLQREGRLYPDPDFTPTADIHGLNFQTARPRRDILDDYERILETIYRPAEYFVRVRRVGRMLNRPKLGAAPLLRMTFRELPVFARLAWSSTRQPELRKHFWRTILECAIHNPRALPSVCLMLALYLHFGPFSRYVRQRVRHDIALIVSGQWSESQWIAESQPLPVSA